MKTTFLGTGSAWGLNELSPDMVSQAVLNSPDPHDKRLRTSLYVEVNGLQILVDCGPDFAQQRRKFGLKNLDALLITHPHRDHINGLDDLIPYQRAKAEWDPIPAYAHADAWQEIKVGKGFYYLMEGRQILSERIVYPECHQPIGKNTSITPFKTSHGTFAPGSVGYVIDAGNKRMVYTSDFKCLEKDGIESKGVEDDGKWLPVNGKIDYLILETNWFNEPRDNPWGHMSFQRGMAFIREWNPRQVYLVHFGDEDQIPGDPLNVLPSKRKPQDPLPYKVPRNHQGWDESVRAAFSDDPVLKKYCQQKDIVAYDGLIVGE